MGTGHAAVTHLVQSIPTKASVGTEAKSRRLRPALLKGRASAWSAEICCKVAAASFTRPPTGQEGKHAPDFEDHVEKEVVHLEKPLQL